MPGLVRGVARTAVIAGTATSVSNRVSRRQAGKWAAQDQQAQPQQQAYAQPPPPAPAAPAQTDLASELQRLGDMKAQGLLSDAEFQAAKAKLLNG